MRCNVNLEPVADEVVDRSRATEATDREYERPARSKVDRGN
ncbi:hypothetical protein LCGC14_0329860 [marine sediment metagenome]|uniref:Uncharacterized protein n=1 Tax=marine sediment metagenome TaxID=412755 RepID=A0A0F9WNY1_9ZZZZ